jgi:spore maturation protein CgeB
MKWVIKSPAPATDWQIQWGDYHFGKSLSKELNRLDQEVVTQFFTDWHMEETSDVILVLRGLHPYAQPTRDRGTFRVMWNISHPADVSIEEYESYDLVFVASISWAEELKTLITRPVFPLLQCTDLEIFSQQRTPNGDGRQDFVFVGNTRDAERRGVLWALDYGIPLKVWGMGWEEWAVEVVDTYFPNDQLNSLYSRARATINDHWDDMKSFGFINNRILDALACGLPVISDYHSELKSTFSSGVLFYRDKHGFHDCVERVMLNYPEIQADMRTSLQTVRRDFSFQLRTQQLVSIVQDQFRSSHAATS